MWELRDWEGLEAEWDVGHQIFIALEWPPAVRRTRSCRCAPANPELVLQPQVHAWDSNSFHPKPSMSSGNVLGKRRDATLPIVAPGKDREVASGRLHDAAIASLQTSEEEEDEDEDDLLSCRAAIFRL